MSAEIAFEKFAIALESTRGTLVTPPTHILNATATLTPQAPREGAPVTDGTLANRRRSIASRKWAEWSAEGDLDTVMMPLLGNMALATVTSPSTPSGATNSRLWAFTRSMGTNTLKTATCYFGDPNVMHFRSPFGFVSQIAITADGTGTSPSTFSVEGMAQFPVSSGSVTAVTKANPAVVTSPRHGLSNGDDVTFASVGGMTELNGNSYTVANVTTSTFELASTDSSAYTTYTSGGYWTLDAPTWPSQVIGNLISPMEFQMWLDTSSSIGTTAVTGRLLSATHTIPTGLVQKFVPSGPGGSRTYTKLGVTKSNPTTTIVFELTDPAQYNLFREETLVKLRVRHNGALIETGFYEYVEVDAYGYLEGLAWGDYEGANRTVEFTIEHQYDSTLGSDLRLAVQNARTSL